MDFRCFIWDGIFMYVRIFLYEFLSIFNDFWESLLESTLLILVLRVFLDLRS